MPGDVRNSIIIPFDMIYFQLSSPFKSIIGNTKDVKGIFSLASSPVRGKFSSETPVFAFAGRYRETNEYLFTLIREGKLGPIKRVIDFGIGADNIIDRAGFIKYYSPTFFELAKRLTPILGRDFKLIGIDR
ncbi:MAG: hypothetical protein Q8K15_03045, partial [Candidatus Omnitrophota bacterium]|nr:hypothetical protein [Candidatus Omnitrophota bacterium]